MPWEDECTNSPGMVAWIVAWTISVPNVAASPSEPRACAAYVSPSWRGWSKNHLRTHCAMFLLFKRFAQFCGRTPYYGVAEVAQAPRVVA